MNLKSENTRAIYTFGGNNGLYIPFVDMLSIASDTATCVSKGNILTVGRGAGAAALDKTTENSYVMAGADQSAALLSTEMHSAAVDTGNCVAKGSLTQARTLCSGGQSTITGYCVGHSGNLTTIDAITFAVNTAAGVLKGALSVGRGYNVCTSI